MSLYTWVQFGGLQTFSVNNYTQGNNPQTIFCQTNGDSTHKPVNHSVVSDVAANGLFGVGFWQYDGALVWNTSTCPTLLLYTNKLILPNSGLSAGRLIAPASTTITVPHGLPIQPTAAFFQFLTPTFNKPGVGLVATLPANAPDSTNWAITYSFPSPETLQFHVNGGFATEINWMCAYNTNNLDKAFTCGYLTTATDGTNYIPHQLGSAIEPNCVLLQPNDETNGFMKNPADTTGQLKVDLTSGVNYSWIAFNPAIETDYIGYGGSPI